MTADDPRPAGEVEWRERYGCGHPNHGNLMHTCAPFRPAASGGATDGEHVEPGDEICCRPGDRLVQGCRDASTAASEGWRAPATSTLTGQDQS